MKIEGNCLFSKWLLGLSLTSTDLSNLSAVIFTSLKQPLFPPRNRVQYIRDLQHLDFIEGFPEPNRVIGNRLIKVVGNSSALLCPSEFVKERIKSHFPEFTSDRVLVIPPLHDSPQSLTEEECAPELFKLAINRPYFLHLGEIGALDAVATSMQAFSHSQASQAQMMLALVAPRSKSRKEKQSANANRQRVIELSQRFQITEQIYWLEQDSLHQHLPHPSRELRALLSAAEGIIAPHPYASNPRDIHLAMACGAPGVAAQAGCYPEILNGCWPTVDWADYRSFSRHIDRQLIDPHYRRELSAAALTQATLLSSQKCHTKLFDFLQQRN